MTVYGQLVGNSFDILYTDETDTSLVRKNNEVRLTYKQGGKLIRFVKLTAAKSPVAGDFLVAAHNGVLMSTGDRNSKRVVAKLLANPEQSTETKTVMYNNVAHTVRLLPVQIL